MKTKVSILIATIISLAVFSCKPKYSMVFNGSSPAVKHKVKESPLQNTEKTETVVTIENNNQEEIKIEKIKTTKKPSIKEVIAAVKAVKKIKKAQKQMPQAAALNNKMSKADKKVAKAKMKEQIKSMKKANKTNGGTDPMFIVAVICCFLLPPLGVFLFEEAIGTNFWIDLILTLLFWLPGVIYALLVVGGVI